MTAPRFDARTTAWSPEANARRGEPAIGDIGCQRRARRSFSRLARHCAALAALLLPAAPLWAAPQPLARYVGCWVTPAFVPIVILTDAGTPNGWTLSAEKMLLEIERIPKTDHLVLGHFFAWQEGEKRVIGPVYQDGAYDPVAGTLTMGSPGGGLNTVQLLPDGRLLYLHTKAAQTADMSVRHLDRIDCDAARGLEQKLRAAQR